MAARRGLRLRRNRRRRYDAEMRQAAVPAPRVVMSRARDLDR